VPGAIRWDWKDPRGQRRLSTVEDHILWSYSMLSISRQIMERRLNGDTDPFPRGRSKACNIEMTKYQSREKNISPLDRDDWLAQNGIKVCAHCGADGPKFHIDHLIPSSRLKDRLDLNQVRSCAYCNLNRGNKDLMHWHRQRQTFPTLGVLRRYLKLCYFYSKTRGCLGAATGEAVESGLPFDPRLLPRKFPSIDALVWDYAYPNVR
jgi:hypothetical protein